MFKKIVGLGFSTKGKNRKEVESYITQLVEWGATEFFTWYNPEYWYEKFGFEVSPNGRFAQHEQITDFETLEAIVQEVHKHNFELFINLNAWYYTDVTFPYIQQMVEEFQKVWVDGIICGNISILEYLKSIGYAGKINISTIMALYNTQSIAFFLENYNVNKVILSREITLKEIEKLVSSFPQMRFEVFGEGDFCRYNNGLCYAEHKYGARDICTVVVNDLIYRKKFRPDFKKIILDMNISDLEKIGCFDDRFENIFEKIEHILTRLELWEDRELLLNELGKIYEVSASRVDIFYDGLHSSVSEKNKNVLIYFKGLKNLLTSWEASTYEHLRSHLEALENNIKSGMKYYLNMVKKQWGEPKLKALELGLFYAKGDMLNLYSYVFFSKFPNIETVKFPTRGRNYNQKLQLIERVVTQGEVDESLIDRWVSIERSHYDLTYLFGEKDWFKKLLQTKWE